MTVLLFLFACSTSAPSPEATSQEDAILAAADARDGATDHVVSRCAGCGLGMAGSPDHAVEHGKYTLHFCSATCADTFTANPDKAVEELASAVE